MVADRCTDDTVEIARGFPTRVIEKTLQKWRNSYAESLQTGYLDAKANKYIAIVDADVVIPLEFFTRMQGQLQGKVASVSSNLLVYPSNGVWNRIIYYWQRTYSLAPLGAKPWGACRLISKPALDVVGSFRDTNTPDSDLDKRMALHGYASIMDSSVTAYHMRRIDSGKIIAGQITSGRGRYHLGESLVHTVAHALLRVRPFVVAGWLMEYAQGEGRH